MRTGSRKLRMIGTVVQIEVTHAEPERLLNEAVVSLKEDVRRFSANDKDSELMKVKQLSGISPVRVHLELYELIKIGKAHSLEENSYLNISIGPLVKLWGIGFLNVKKPTETEIKTAMQLTHPQDIELMDLINTWFIIIKPCIMTLVSTEVLMSSYWTLNRSLTGI